MDDTGDNWSEVVPLLLDFERREFALRLAVNELASGRSPDETIGALLNLRKQTLAEAQARAPGKIICPNDAEMPATPETARLELACAAVLKAYEEAQRSFWLAQVELSKRGPCIAPSPGVEKGVLARLRGETEPYVDYGYPCVWTDETGDIVDIIPHGISVGPAEAFGDELTASDDRFRRYLDAPAVLVSVSLPQYVLDALDRARSAFVLGHCDATLALCRSVAEATAHHWLVEQREIARDTTSDWSKRDAALLRKLRPDLGASQDNVELIRREANNILHPKQRTQRAEEDKARDALRCTFTFVEQLFRKGSAGKRTVAAGEGWSG